MFSKKPAVTNKDILANLFEVPSNKINVYDDDEYKNKQDAEQKKKNLIERRKGLDEKNKNIKSKNPSGKIVNPDGSTSITNTDGTDSAQKIDEKDATKTDNVVSTDKSESIPSNFNFNSSINENDQNIIKGLVPELHTILQLPELSVTSDKSKIEGEPGTVTIVETTINEADDSEKQDVEKLMIEPFIVV
jgi:hypothetical protein